MTIEELVRTWAAAVHSGDMAQVLAHHADDIVMFDVPPPHEGVRGIKAYEETWPPFFHWQAGGSVFDIVEIDVTEGEDVAYVWARVNCGMPDDLAEHPERTMRLTLGLRKESGEWVVAHEHHSFCDLSTPDAAG